MKIYDMHIHINIGPDVEPNQLLDRMNEAGVSGGALFSAGPETGLYWNKAPYRERLDHLFRWTKGKEGVFFPILWIHPHEKDACEIVKDAAASGVAGFKMICDNYYIYDAPAQELMAAIEKTGLPTFFHSGILWAGTDTSKYNRPLNWECLLNFEGLRFSMGHCSWPWHDECIAMYGKFLHSYHQRLSSEMFFDLTPGTPPIYRRDLLTKLFTVGYDVQHNLMFGTDSMAHEYHPDWVKSWLDRDNAIYDELGVTAEQRQLLFHDNLMRFLKNEKIDHYLPHVNKLEEHK